LGRRIEFIDATNAVTKRYVHDGDQVLEEYDAAGARQRYYVWGNYIDELLLMHADAGNGADQKHRNYGKRQTGIAANNGKMPHRA
jgi:hypothetical protein